MSKIAHLLPDKPSFDQHDDLQPPPKKRTARSKLHPEARMIAIAEKVTANLKPIPVSGWRWAYGWKILLTSKDGSIHRRDTGVQASYEDAVCLRDAEMRTGDYEKAWIIMKVE